MLSLSRYYQQILFNQCETNLGVPPSSDLRHLCLVPPLSEEDFLRAKLTTLPSMQVIGCGKAWAME